jgi:hypothetical protein
MPWPGLSLIAVARKSGGGAMPVRSDAGLSSMSLNRRRGSAVAGGFASRRILVVGDLMLDEFIWGKGLAHLAGSAGSHRRRDRRIVLSRRRRQRGAQSEGVHRQRGAHGLAGDGRLMGDRLLDCWKLPASIRPMRAARRRLLHHYQDADHRAQPAGGARGPRAEDGADGSADRARHRTTGRHGGGSGCHRGGRLRQGLRDPAAGRPSLPMRRARTARS